MVPNVRSNLIRLIEGGGLFYLFGPQSGSVVPNERGKICTHTKRDFPDRPSSILCLHSKSKSLWASVSYGRALKQRSTVRQVAGEGFDKYKAHKEAF